MKKFVLLLSLILSSWQIQAQSDTNEVEESDGADVMMISANADSAFMQARDLTFEKEYKASR